MNTKVDVSELKAQAEAAEREYHQSVVARRLIEGGGTLREVEVAHPMARGCRGFTGASGVRRGRPMTDTQAPYGLAQAEPLPQHGLEADNAAADTGAGPVSAHEAQTPGSGPERCLRIDRITIGERHRKSFGRIEELAESIAQLGLLQPIGVDRGHRLIFGARRIAAFEHLGRKTIPARVIAIDDLLDGEHAENLIRKEFTPSERVAIGKSMAARLGERRGGDTSKGTQSNPQNFGECKGRETAEF